MTNDSLDRFTMHYEEHQKNKPKPTPPLHPLVRYLLRLPQSLSRGFRKDTILDTDLDNHSEDIEVNKALNDAPVPTQDRRVMFPDGSISKPITLTKKVKK